MLTNSNLTAMIPQLRKVEQRPRPQAPQRFRSLKEERQADYAPELSVDALAGQEARLIIRAFKLEDSTQTWRALKAAYVKGFDEAAR